MIPPPSFNQPIELTASKQGEDALRGHIGLGKHGCARL